EDAVVTLRPARIEAAAVRAPRWALIHVAWLPRARALGGRAEANEPLEARAQVGAEVLRLVAVVAACVPVQEAPAAADGGDAPCAQRDVQALRHSVRHAAVGGALVEHNGVASQRRGSGDPRAQPEHRQAVVARVLDVAQTPEPGAARPPWSEELEHAYSAELAGCCAAARAAARWARRASSSHGRRSASVAQNSRAASSTLSPAVLLVWL